MSDILEDLERANSNVIHYSSGEAIQLIARAAEEISRLRAALRSFADLGHSANAAKRYLAENSNGTEADGLLQDCVAEIERLSAVFRAASS